MKEADKFRPSSLFEGMTSIRAVLRAADEGTNDRSIREILYDKDLTKSHIKEVNYLSKIAPQRCRTRRLRRWQSAHHTAAFSRTAPRARCRS